MASEIKPTGGLERVKLANVLPLETPFTLYVFPTTFCNFKCSYCAHSLGLKKMKETYDFTAENMSLETFDKLISDLKQFKQKIKVISLTGQGEPLINKDIPTMIRKIKEADICERVEIISNGALLTNELSLELINAGLDILRISLQGVTSEKYKEVCGVNIDFDKYLSQLAFYHKSQTEKNKLYVKTLDIALDEGEEELFYNLFRDISDRMFIDKCQPIYENVELTKDYDINYDRYGNIHEKRDVCTICFYMMGIFPNGDITPCDAIYKPVVWGNVNTKDIYEIWNSQQRKDFLKLQLNRNRYANPKCKVCCAPDDVTCEEDVLDNDTESILARL